MSEKNVPNVRFKGFSESWEQRKLGMLMDVTSVKRIHQADWQTNGIPFFRARDIVAASKNKKIDEPIFISFEKYEEYSTQSGKVTPGDLLVTGVGSIGVPYLITDNSPLYFKDGNIIWFKNSSLEPYFFYYQFKATKIQNYIISNSGTGTVGTYTIQSGKNTPIFITGQEEQAKIGSILSSVDKLIASNQRKLDQLKKVKKLLMQKIFDQEWRFKGFTDPWEQRKFKKLYRKNTEKNEYQFTSDKTISIATMVYKTEGNGASDKSIPGYKVLRVGDIAFEGHKSKEFSFGRFVLNDIGDGIMSPRFTTLRPLKNTNIQFWKYYIHYEPIMKKVLVRSTKLGTMMNELVLDDLFKQSLLVPSNLEQEKIGALLKKIDLIIASNQQKLDQLKEMKKWFMQNMFV